MAVGNSAILDKLFILLAYNYMTLSFLGFFPWSLWSFYLYVSS